MINNIFQIRDVFVGILFALGGAIIGVFIALMIINNNQTSIPLPEAQIQNEPSQTFSTESSPHPQDSKQNKVEEIQFLQQIMPSPHIELIKCLGADRKYSYVPQQVCDVVQQYWKNVLGSLPTDPEEIIRCQGADGLYSIVSRKTCEDTNKFWEYHTPANVIGISVTTPSSNSSGDNTPPTTIDDVDSSWHNSAVTITLTCSDDVSGCDKTYYTTDGSTPTIFSNVSEGLTVSFTAEGSYTLKYFSVDKAGNRESVNTATNNVQIDTTAPTIPGTPSYTTICSDTTPTWIWTASSDSGSGLATNAYTMQWSKSSTFSSEVGTATATTNTYTHTTPLSTGLWYFRVLATDTAGNSSNYSNSGTLLLSILCQ